jgi:NTP pyrophosphatase (non-canonical NTP hydrolase)
MNMQTPKTKELELLNKARLIDVFATVSQHIHDVAVEHGWWEADRNTGEAFCLMHAEISEALEWDRHGNPKSDHIPEFSGVEEELADVIIRILDFAKGKQLHIAEAMLAKMEFNRNRPYKHGGKKY